MAGLLAFGPVLLPEFRDPDAGRLDLLSAGLSLAGVLAVIYGLKRIAEDGLAGPPDAVHRRRCRTGRCFRAAPAQAVRPPDRPPALPHPRMQRGAGHRPADPVHVGRHVPLPRPVPPTRQGLLPPGGRSVAAPGRRRQRRGIDALPGPHQPATTRHRPGRRPGGRSHRLRGHNPDRTQLEPRQRRHRLCRLLGRHRLHRCPHDGPGRRRGSPHTSRRSRGTVRDRR